MWKGLKKVLGKPGKCKKSSFDKYALDVSTRSTSSAAPSSVVFPLDLDADAFAAWHEQSVHLGQRQPADNTVAEPLTYSQLQQHIAQQVALQKLVQPQDDHSVSKRRAAALQKRLDNAMLNPSTCLYQISSLLSLSTLFEHKLQRDALVALQQTPDSLISRAAAAASAAAGPSCGSPMSCSCGQAVSSAAGSSSCSFCNPSGLQRAPSATAASTAHVALQLVRWGYRVIVRKVLHSKAYWTKAMDNTFIVALDTSSGSHVEYIVDPHFKETFNVGVMSENYSAVWQSLPQVFIGMPCQLQPVVQLLCEEMELSFLEAGRPCPPWREWAATINRWMSDQYVDILVPEPDAPDEEIVEYITRCCQFNGTSAAAMGDSSASTATASTANSCSPVALNQQRLLDKMHVSSVLSSTSTCSKRPVHEPLHKQMGFAAVTEDKSTLLPSAGVRDASFTSVSSDTSAASMQMLLQVQAAAAAKGSIASVAGSQSFSVPAANNISGSATSACSAESLAAADGDEMHSGTGPGKQVFMHTGQQQKEIVAAAPDLSSAAAVDVDVLRGQQQAQQGLMETAAHQMQLESNVRSASSSTSCSSTGDNGGVSTTGPRRRKSLLTERMQLKTQLQQGQHRLLLAGLGSNHYMQPMLQPNCPLQLQALQQQQQLQAMQQQQQLQAMQQQQQLQAMQQQQQLQAMQQQQQQQQLHAMQQQQQQLIPLLPVVHTVRPCGVAQAPPVVGVAIPRQQQQHVHTQQLCSAQPQVVQPPLQQDQPKLLRLIQRNK